MTVQAFTSQYVQYPERAGWDSSFGKPGLVNISGVEHQQIYAGLKTAWMRNGKAACIFCGREQRFASLHERVYGLHAELSLHGEKNS